MTPSARDTGRSREALAAPAKRVAKRSPDVQSGAAATPKNAKLPPSVPQKPGRAARSQAPKSALVERTGPAGTSTLDLALRMIEFLALQSAPMPLAQIASAFGASKATVYRHLVTLQRHGFVRQEQETGRYEAGVKLVVLGEALRSRFDILTTARADLIRLRDTTEQAVTLCAVVEEHLVVLELVQGRTIIEFATRPGTRMDFHASAHGRVWLAFGDPALRQAVLASTLRQWTPSTMVSPAELCAEIDAVRARGFATAPDQVITGVNTLAAPVFDHRGRLAASIAIVGATQFIAPTPSDTQIAEVVGTATRISRGLGWSKSKDAARRDDAV